MSNRWSGSRQALAALIAAALAHSPCQQALASGVYSQASCVSAGPGAGAGLAAAAAGPGRFAGNPLGLAAIPGMNLTLAAGLFLPEALEPAAVSAQASAAQAWTPAPAAPLKTASGASAMRPAAERDLTVSGKRFLPVQARWNAVRENKDIAALAAGRGTGASAGGALSAKRAGDAVFDDARGKSQPVETSPAPGASRYYEPKAFERSGRLYEWLGVRFAGAFLNTMNPVPLPKAQDRRSIDAWRSFAALTRELERTHLRLLAGSLSLQAVFLSALGLGALYSPGLWSVWTVAAGVSALQQLLGNIYPIMVQRYNRSRAREIIGRLEAPPPPAHSR